LWQPERALDFLRFACCSKAASLARRRSSGWKINAIIGSPLFVA
jgi:hypothetical protein